MTLASSLGAIVLSLSLASATRADASFSQCDPARTSAITLASLTALPFLDAARTELESIRAGADRSRFEAWFGDVTADRLAYVEALLEAVQQGGVNEASYVCDASARCSDGAPDVRVWTENGSAIRDGYGVYVCESFYAEKLVDQAGLLVHEYAHLYGARDYTQDELKEQGDPKTAEDFRRAARAFASAHPRQAIFIAYNLGFFVMDR